jgi:hypothetical protein
VAERRRQPVLAHAGRADERQIVVGLDPFSLGELLEQRAVETTRAAIIDVLDGRLLAASLLSRRHEASRSSRSPSHS